ncbi:hypothetical protein pb186bvf_020760 [Paramecium bursaria]
MLEEAKDQQNDIKRISQTHMTQMMSNKYQIKGNFFQKIVCNQLNFFSDWIILQNQFEVISLYQENDLHKRQRLFKKLFKQDLEIYGLQKTLSQHLQRQNHKHLQLQFIYRTISKIKQNILNFRLFKQRNLNQSDQEQIDQKKQQTIKEYINQGVSQIQQNNLLVQSLLSKQIFNQIHVIVDHFQQFLEVKELISHKKYVEALELCLRNNFQNYDFLLLKAVCYYKQKKYLQSIQICNQLQFMTRNDVRVLYLQGLQINYCKENPFQEIRIQNKPKSYFMKLFILILQVSKHIINQVQHQKYILFSGNALDQQRKFEQALIMYDHALELNPYNIKTYKNKGNALRKLGKFKKAMKMYNKALEINPYDAESFQNKGKDLDLFSGVTQLEQGKFQKAMCTNDTALKIKPNSIESIIYQGQNFRNISGVTQVFLGKFEEANIMIDLVLKKYPNLIQIYLFKGNALALQGKFDEAQLMFYEALKINPKSSDTYCSQGKNFYLFS